MRTLEDKIKVVLAKHYECRMSMYEASDTILTEVRNKLNDEFYKLKDLDKPQILDSLRKFLMGL